MNGREESVCVFIGERAHAENRQSRSCWPEYPKDVAVEVLFPLHGLQVRCMQRGTGICASSALEEPE